MVEAGADLGGNAMIGAVQVERTVDAPVAAVWRTLVGPGGAEALLGRGASFGTKGEPWRSEDGPSGVLRSYHPLEQLRWTWHETPDAPSSIVELDLDEHEGGTKLSLRHDGISDPDTYEARWSDALTRLSGAVTA